MSPEASIESQQVSPCNEDCDREPGWHHQRSCVYYAARPDTAAWHGGPTGFAPKPEWLDEDDSPDESAAPAPVTSCGCPDCRVHCLHPPHLRQFGSHLPVGVFFCARCGGDARE